MKWYHPSKSDKFPSTPWLHPNAIEYLESILKSDMQVMEFGGGGSTLWFADKVKQVITCEPDHNWFEKLFDISPENVSVFNRLEPLKMPADLIFIDGEPVEIRGNWLIAAVELVNAGGYVVLDNANRPEYKAERRWLEKHMMLVYTSDGNEENTHYLVTEFWQK